MFDAAHDVAVATAIFLRPAFLTLTFELGDIDFVTPFEDLLYTISKFIVRSKQK